MSVHATFERIAVITVILYATNEIIADAVLCFLREQANITHKNQRVKEGLLAVITRLQEMHGSEQLRAAVSAQTMCTTVSVLLNDAQAGTRQLAVTTLAGLYPTYKEELVVRQTHLSLPPLLSIFNKQLASLILFATGCIRPL